MDSNGKIVTYGVWDQGNLKTTLNKKKYEALKLESEGKQNE